jgi:ParB family chromosome partitioning protein
MTKKPTPSPLIQGRRVRQQPYRAGDFDALKADVLARGSANGGERVTTQLATGQLQRGRFQPRAPADDAALAELADSIRVLGILEPILVRPLPESPGVYEILAGERRWRAAQQVGLDQVPVVVHPVDDRTAAAITLVENLQREDLNPIEEATALQGLAETFGLTQAQVGELIGKSESAVSRALGLLTLPEQVREWIRTGQLEAGHGKVLLNMGEESQRLLAEQAVKAGWSVRELEQRKAALKRRKPQRTMPAADPDLKRLERRLNTWLCAPVRIVPGKKGGGIIQIRYANVAECDSLLERFNLPADDHEI